MSNGKITAETLDAVRRAAVLSEIVGSRVALSEPRAGRQKGLCPFHDEKSPSFTVDDGKGLYYCFGCGDHGDVFTFVQKIDHTSFFEAVRLLAERTNVPFTLSDGSVEDEVTYSRRQRLVEANRVAAEFFTDRLADVDAELARSFLVERGFDVLSAVKTFNVGFSPRGWDDLTSFLVRRGFTEDEIVDAGLATRSEKGVFDRFRGRLMWPIFNERGENVGFGGRQLFPEENSAKYVNTTDTLIYKKSSTLFGLNLALNSIAKKSEVIVVEGYTDVMAMHAAGVHNVIASSGTAFGDEHIRVLRRVLAPNGVWKGRIVFAFDGDDAGRKAAVRAFGNTVRDMVSVVFAVSNPDGCDPCDVRLTHGDEAVREIFASPVPLLQFVIDRSLGSFDLTSIQGRVGAVEEVRQVLSTVPDEFLVSEYSRYAAKLLGVPVSELKVRGAARVDVAPPNGALSPAEQVEFEALKVLVQCPDLSDWRDSLEVESFTLPLHQRAAGLVLSSGGLGVHDLLERCRSDEGRSFVSRLAVEPLAVREGGDSASYGVSVLARLLVQNADRAIGVLKVRLASGEDVERELVGLSAYRRDLLTLV